MKKNFLIFLLLAFIGCKKDKPVVAPIEKSAKAEKFKKEMKGLAIDSVSLGKNPDSLLVAFYRMNHFETVWNEAEIRKAVIFTLSKAGEDGLEAKDYGVEKLQASEKKARFLSEKDRIAYDLLLTTNLRKYLRHLSHGKINPLALYQNWDLKRNKFDINTLLSGGISGDSLSAVIEKAKPSHIIYKKLKLALQIINQYPEDNNLKKIDTLSKIRRNDTIACMIDIKKKLIYWKDMPPQDSLTKIYDRKTFTAMKKFQFRHGLIADGVIGKGTIKALNYSRDERKGQIIANLERWRWFPRDMGNHYIIINIPGYVLSVVKNNDTIEQKKIVVGKHDRRTPVLSSTFSNIIFNPTWTVPPTILREDLTPSATKNRGYFAEKNIVIYNSKGKEVSPEDWNPGKAKSYRYTQKPGDDNSLGNVKFNFPNRFTVYLHDTNHRNLFVMHNRSFSSGCVRVENPLPLAQYMLNDSIHWSLEKINEVVASKKTTSITLKEKIRIHQLYWTAWSDAGKLIFRDDIYDLDAGLYAALRK